MKKTLIIGAGALALAYLYIRGRNAFAVACSELSGLGGVTTECAQGPGVFRAIRLGIKEQFSL